MTSLTVWHYDTPLGAEAGELRLKGLVEREAVVVHDAVTVSWMPGADAPVVGSRLRHSTAVAAGKGSVLGALVGLVLFAPGVGAALGAGVGAVTQRLRATGIEPEFLELTRSSLIPGSSALVVLSSEANPDAIEPVLHRSDAVLVHAELADDAPERLRHLFDDFEQRTDAGTDPGVDHRTSQGPA